MSMRKLFDGDIEGYFNDNADFDKAFWFFVHIPKTAGSSFRSELAAALRPNANITLNYALDGESFESWRKNAVKRFLAEHETKQHRFASGHIMNGLLGDLRTVEPNTRMVTMLRHPADRLISDFRYARTPMHPPYQEFIKRYPTIQDYIAAPESADKMAVFLESTPNQPAKDLIAELEQTFSFVGLTEMYPLTRRTLFSLLNINAGPVEHKRKTEDTADNRVEVTAELREQIIKANPRDMALYRHFRAGWVAQREKLVEHLKQRAIVTAKAETRARKHEALAAYNAAKDSGNKA